MGMAEANKRIDLAAPLLSVRRHGGAGAVDAAPPSDTADATSRPLGHTGAVPFRWEQRPGHPKSVRTRRPPPPLPSPAAIVGAASGRAQTPTAAAAREEAEKHAQDDDERFTDARDVLSRDDVSCATANCSVTGLSDAAVAVAAPGFRNGGAMLDRFLPAAQAIAVGSPQCTFRKAASAREPARPAASSARMGGSYRSPVQGRLPLQRIPANHLPPLSPEDGTDDDDDDGDTESVAQSTRGFASKRCGLLPTRCVKRTLMLLNPSPSMRRRGPAKKPLLSNDGGRSQIATNPLLRRSRKEQQPLQHNGGHDLGMQSWKDLYVKSLLRSGRGGGTEPAGAMASELDRTVLQLYGGRGGEAVHPKPSHLGFLLVLDRSSDERHGYHRSSARNLSQVAGETALLLPPPPKGSQIAGKKLRRGAADAGEYGFPLLLEDKAAVAGREIVLSPPEHLLPLPLPKSPSESWLSRALPSVSHRPPATSFLGLHVQSRKHDPSPWCSIDPANVVDHAGQRHKRLHDLLK
ncbi:hypothetical protein ACP70R_039638 [Stipagrostis hirtigluma subsp. patula]